MIFEEIHVSVDKGAFTKGFIYIISFRHLYCTVYMCNFSFLIYILEKFNCSLVDNISAYMPYKGVETGKEEVVCPPPPSLYFFKDEVCSTVQ